MSAESTPKAHPETTAYYLDARGDLTQGEVISHDGAELLVQHAVGKAIHRARKHRAEVFNASQIGGVAAELLPEPADGNEILFSEALKAATDDPTKAAVLSGRLQAEAIANYVGSEYSAEDMGLRTKERLVGSPAIRGSNRWKIDELLAGVKSGMYSREEGTTNDLEIARLRPGIAALTPPERVHEVAMDISRVNREALDELYDTNDVDFQHARVWTRTVPGGEERATVYPQAGDAISFVETYFQSNLPDNRDVSNGPTLINAQVYAGVPDFPLEKGYLPA
jgi:hypothetical protein